MSSLTQRVRRSFMNVSAGVTLAAVIGSASAQAAPILIFTDPAEGLPQNCVPFDTNRPSFPNPYNQILSKTVEQLKNYSNFSKLFEAAKQNGVEVEGLCTGLRPLQHGTAIYSPESKSFLLNMQQPGANGPSPFHPDHIMELVNQGIGSFSTTIIATLTTAAYDSEQDPFFKERYDLETLTLLSTMAFSQTLSEQILFAAESAAEDNDKSTLNYTYNMMPQMVQELSDLHAKALVAKAEGRGLTDEERHNFRAAFISSMMKSPEMRARASKAAANIMIQMSENKLNNDLETGQTPTLPVTETYSPALIKQAISRFPGHEQLHPAVESYKDYWQSQQTADSLPSVQIQVKAAQDDMLQQVRQILRANPPGRSPRPSPTN